MKLEKVFEVKEARLYKIGGAEQTNPERMAKAVAWSAVEPSLEAYDEAFLATLRDELKNDEATGTFVFIEPIVDKPITDAASYEQFTAAMKHCARRIKDCVSVAGFAIPAALVATGFAPGSIATAYREALSEKHAQYVFFCKRSDVAQSGTADAVPADTVLY